MRYLFEQWNKIERNLNNKYLMLFLDFDGTLSPIAKTPQKAFIPKETRELLKRLIEAPKCMVAVVSGRALKDIKNKIGIKELIYVGNHGLELEGPKIKFKATIPLKYKENIGKIKSHLNKNLSSVKGTFVEDKGLSLSLHYRLVRSKDIAKVKSVFRKAVVPYLIKNEIEIKTGKMVLEVRPPLEWDKGKVVLWLLARQRFILNSQNILPIYIGDDVTDEDAFKVLKNKGLAIFVGHPKNSSAKYYLRNNKDVTKFLKQILEIENRIICQN